MAIPWADILNALQNNQGEDSQPKNEDSGFGVKAQTGEDNQSVLLELQRQTQIIQDNIQRRNKEEEESKKKEENLKKIEQQKEEDRKLHDFSNIDKDELRKAIEYANSIEDKEETLGEALYFDELDAAEYGL